MPVLLDSATGNAEVIAPGTSSGAITLTHHVSPLATNVVAIVGVLWTGSVSLSGATFTPTFGGTALTALGSPITWTDSSLQLYELTGPAAGANTVEMAYTGISTGASTANLFLVSATYSGVASIGTPVTNSTGSVTANAVTVASTAAAYRVISVHGVGGNDNFTAFSGTKRAHVTIPLGGALLIGDSPGATSVTNTATQGSTSYWGAFGINLVPAPVQAGFSGPQIALGAGSFRGGVYRPTIPPASRTWVIDVGSLYGPVDSRIGPRGASVADAYLNSDGQLVFQVVDGTGVAEDIPTPITIPEATSNGDGTISIATS